MSERLQLNLALAYCHPGWMAAQFVDSLTAMLRRWDVVTNISLASGPRIASSRNRLVRAFLDNSTADYLLMLDTDMVFDPDMPLELMRAANDKHPIVGGLCFGFHATGDAFPVLFDRDLKPIDRFPPDKLMEVGATGAACLLIHRKVFEALDKRHDAPFTWFQDTAIDGKDTGEDVEFCVRARKAGFPVKVHTGIKIGHVKSFVVTENHYLR